MDIYTLLVVGHVIGTILGTGGATIAELQINKALKDNKVSDEERTLMHIDYGMIRVGMAFIAVSVIGMFWYFSSQGDSFLFTSQRIWAKELMFGFIIINAIALHKRWIPLWLGASISFTSWWGAAILGMLGDMTYSFVAYVIIYVIAIIAVAGALHLFRTMHSIRNKKKAFITSLALLAAVALVSYRVVQLEFFDWTKGTPAGEEIVLLKELSGMNTYSVPGGSHTLKFILLVDTEGTIKGVKGLDLTAPDHQSKVDEFSESVLAIINGKKLSDLNEIDRVGTSSLTTNAFNAALLEIKKAQG